MVLTSPQPTRLISHDLVLQLTGPYGLGAAGYARPITMQLRELRHDLQSRSYVLALARGGSRIIFRRSLFARGLSPSRLCIIGSCCCVDPQGWLHAANLPP